MTYDYAAHRDSVHRQCLALVAAGPGWDPYALDRARNLHRDDPTMHADLPAAVEAAMGAQRLRDAKAALRYFERVAS